MITNLKQFPELFLVKISRCRMTTRRQLQFYEPNVPYCPGLVNSILEAVLKRKALCRPYSKIIKEAILALIKEEEGTIITEGEAVQFVIESIIEFEVFRLLLADERDTRGKSKCRKKIRDTALAMRKKRMSDEHHLPCSFVDDLLRTKNELLYAVLNCKC